MRHIENDLLVVFFRPEDAEVGEIVLSVAEATDQLNRELWELKRPERKCRVYITGSGVGFVFRSAPWHLRIWYGILIPFYWYEIWRAWRDAGGWTVDYGRSGPATAVKPPHILERKSSTLGRLLFTQQEPADKFKHLVCHELTHAYSVHLRLPLWLNEGLAMLTVDRYFGEHMIREDTLEILSRPVERQEPLDYGRFPEMTDETIIAHYARAYWITRFLCETTPQTIRDLLATRVPRKTLNERIAKDIGMDAASMWKDLDQRAHRYFSEGRSSSTATETA